jgi:transposase-like protein
MSDLVVASKIISIIKATMTTKHTEAFIERCQGISRGDRSIVSVAADLNINHHTLRYWMKHRTVAQRGFGSKEKRPQDWTAAEQLLAA